MTGSQSTRWVLSFPPLRPQVAGSPGEAGRMMGESWDHHLLLPATSQHPGLHWGNLGGPGGQGPNHPPNLHLLYSEDRRAHKASQTSDLGTSGRTAAQSPRAAPQSLCRGHEARAADTDPGHGHRGPLSWGSALGSECRGQPSPSEPSLPGQSPPEVSRTQAHHVSRANTGPECASTVGPEPGQDPQGHFMGRSHGGGQDPTESQVWMPGKRMTRVQDHTER